MQEMEADYLNSVELIGIVDSAHPDVTVGSINFDFSPLVVAEPPSAVDPPSQPVITKTDYDEGAITLYVTVSDNGGAELTQLAAHCSDGATTVTATSDASPILVTGLNKEIAYTCTVSATNAEGLTSVESVATYPITPKNTQNGAVIVPLINILLGE